MERTIYREIKATAPVLQVGALLVLFILAAAASFFYMEEYGHIVTGMNNQIVWGLPHVFAITLIVGASGALNVASVASVFGKKPYKPFARLSALLAIALLAGGLAVLVLDLGRPDRLIVAMTTYNFTSIFAWNILLYNGFFVLVGAYLYVQMARHMPYAAVRTVGTLAFLWRLILTTGTGSIFGWLVARSYYDSAVLPPLFIALSLSLGTAVFILVLTATARMTGRALGPKFLTRIGQLMGIFAAAVLYFTAVRHLTNLYAAEHGDVERFILFEGGIYTTLFWLGQVLVGGLIPLALVFHPTASRKPAAIVVAALAVVLGAFALIYVTVIGGQAYPLEIFKGYTVTSSFYDGTVAAYTPSAPELFLGLGGVALALMLVGVGMKVLRILPLNMSDTAIGQE